MELMSIGARWKQARESAGLSAAKAATLVGLHENTIYLLENDAKNDGVTLRICRKVADSYGVTLDDIFCDGGRTIPIELRPLTDLLRPLDAEARSSFVRNVVSNARFMASLIAVPSSDLAHVEDGRSTAYNSGSNSTTDAFRTVAGLGGAPAGEPNVPGRAAAVASRTHRSKKENR